MKTFEAQHSNIKVVDVKQNDAFRNSKKYALTLGIKVASYNFLLFTDADCEPSSSNWITSMSSHFSKTKTIVIGYGAYQKVKGSLLNMLIRFETMMTAIQYFSYKKLGMPYMAVGRNLAYRKEVFFETNGFFSHMHVLSGDDDLFINEAATNSNTTICALKNSFTESVPQSSLKEWFNQKKRHVSASNYYKALHKYVLGFYYITQLLFWILGILLMSLLFSWKMTLILIGIRFFVMYLSVFFSAKKLNELDTLILLPFLDLFLVLAQLVIFISNLTSKKQHWR
mgnify:CR=1 FL=1